ncbi:shikimate kinase AroK [Spartinivicinus poritis]|uniref:Shikimate kinase n=1 Tax=Spartinivicinus poritis TaxID=2994640 RepID=A0ABT5U8A9_9GAMM|nr:shikimate kinase AroK [Spartinivicinus sp. A2-2]MDE1461772.1 shikimate kinase AroK [Spartinivicinus sp. A2-2]
MSKYNIFLIGPMGAGKSTIGRLLSKELNLPFKDSDREIEARSGADIPWIFDVEGEEGFRLRETGMLQDLVLDERVVLATGGGAVLRQENRQLLTTYGTVVYLETSVEQQLERTARDKRRPLLQQADPRTVLTELLSVRGPIYESLADITIHTDGKSPRGVVSEITEALDQLNLNRPQ